MDLPALDLLPGVVSDTAVKTAPFSADFSDWLSRIAAVGLAARPLASRTSACNAAQMLSQTPSRWKLRNML